MLFASVDACYPDNITALQAQITSDSSKYLQSSTTSFASHLNANSALYHQNFGRKTLNVGLYMTLFPHTHRCDLQGRTFAQALTDVLQRLGFSYTSASDKFHAQPFVELQRCCHELDTQEAQQRAAPSVPNSLEQLLKQQQQEVAKLTKQVADLQAASRRSRAGTSANASAFNRQGSRSPSPGTRPKDTVNNNAPDSNRKRHQGNSKKQSNDSKQPSGNSALVAEDPTENVKVSSATAHALGAASSHALQHGRSPVALIAADADAILAANLNLNRSEPSVSFRSDTQTAEYGPDSPPSSLRRSARRSKQQLNDTAAAKQTEPPAKVPEASEKQQASSPAHTPPQRGTAAPGNALRKRTPLRADGGDVCDERDSTYISNRRAQLKAFERVHTSTRVSRALLRSPLTLTLADMIALVTDTDLVEVLVRLCAVLEKQSDTSDPSASAAQLSALRAVAAELATDADCLATVKVALATHLDPAESARSWAEVVNTPALWEQFPGKVIQWNVDFSRIRRTRGHLSTSDSVSSQSLDIVFDEGCEVCTIKRSALLEHFAAWQAGHAAFSKRKDIGAPRALCMTSPLHLHAFHGNHVGHSFMVLIHLHLGCAVYPVRAVLVDNAPGDVVLGLPFRRRYDSAFPANFTPRDGHAHGQGLGVTHMCLGVPVGYAVKFPTRKMAEQSAPQSPEESAFKQILAVKPTWQNWRQSGKELSPAELRAYLAPTQA
jgi:hypothetical protein